MSKDLPQIDLLFLKTTRERGISGDHKDGNIVMHI